MSSRAVCRNRQPIAEPAFPIATLSIHVSEFCIVGPTRLYDVLGHGANVQAVLVTASCARNRDEHVRIKGTRALRFTPIPTKGGNPTASPFFFPGTHIG